jgi:hypothetical protein
MHEKLWCYRANTLQNVIFVCMRILSDDKVLKVVKNVDVENVQWGGKFFKH